MTVLCLMGPTAMGKTETAMRLADRFELDLISVDSAMVYRGMDIGTAKPDDRTLARYPHALIDICEPWEGYSVAQFIDDVRREIESSQTRGRVPLLVGGTMLYFRRLFDGLARLPTANATVRARLDAQAAQIGWPAMHTRLQGIDPEAADRIGPNDMQRIQRALEVHELSGRTLTDWLREAREQHGDQAALRFLRIALLSEDRKQLHARINARFDAMMSAGFEAEVERIANLPGVHAALPSMRAVGYRQIGAWLQGRLSRAKAVADAKTATRRLAKRQHTWLRQTADLHCFDPLEADVEGPISELVDGTLSADPDI
ncbi:MAG: tRNA (adenosine(37)-N6)-dimethylallyltransferase MiaA [Pseudomonadota bacterium]